MNNSIDKINNTKALEYKTYIELASEDESASKQICKGGGSSGGEITKSLMIRPIKSLRISEDALKLCIEHNVKPFEYFTLPASQIKKKYGNFFSSNSKDIEKCHEIGHYLTGDHNIPNKCVIEKMKELNEKNPNSDVSEYRKILNEQSYDLITLEENKRLNEAGLQSAGTKEQRDALCSTKYEFIDLWLTPEYVIDRFFELSGLDRNECLDPCACDGRWLKGQGYSIDIIPMDKAVHKHDFLTLTKEEIPSNIKTIVGNVPFSLTKEFVNKAFELYDDCYFLVSGDTIFNYFPDNIEHIYIFSGLEGNQADNRSRCQFDVPFLFKSDLWCCIVHLTKGNQPKWIIEKDLPNEVKRDGFHVALGKNVYIKSDTIIDDNPRISRIKVTSDIKYSGGKKINVNGDIIDIKAFFS